MSVSLSVTHADGSYECVAMCFQQAADDWVPNVAACHGFGVLTGIWPVWVYPHNLRQAIEEVSILRAEAFVSIDAPDERFSEEDRAANRNTWNVLVRKLEELLEEDGWDALFG